MYEVELKHYADRLKLLLISMISFSAVFICLANNSRFFTKLLERSVASLDSSSKRLIHSLTDDNTYALPTERKTVFLPSKPVVVVVVVPHLAPAHVHRIVRLVKMVFQWKLA